MPTSAGPYAGPLAVTLLYVAWYYALQVYVARVKFALDREHAARGEKFDRYFGQDRRMLAADRMQLNLLEHMPPFLVLLWLHAVFVSATSATGAGAVYLVARVSYPVMLGQRLGRGIPSRVLFATLPGYLVLAWLAGGLVVALVSG